MTMNQYTVSFRVDVHVPATSEEAAIKQADAMLRAMGSEKVEVTLGKVWE